MKANAAPVFRAIEGSHKLPARCSDGSEGETLPGPAPSPCLTLALLLSIPLWGAIGAAVFVAVSAWAS
jgi:hypothetical protein